jgi:hypothetical protein
VSEDLEQQKDCILIRCLLKSKYSDLVLLCAVALAFIALILISVAPI